MYPLKTKSKYDVNNLATTTNTYTTVYLGNYVAGDYDEGHGSHPGVDIVPVVPNDSVFACLDGVVQIAANKATEGNYVVIKHDNVPDPSNLSGKTTLYSCYLHLSAYSVTVGQCVSEGDVIGNSGNTGNSTGEHLHFQIDRKEALFHPYWPFSFAEAKAANLGFFEAVNKGLGIDNARKYTIDPLVYLDQIATLPTSTDVVESTPIATSVVTEVTASVSSDFSDVPTSYEYAEAVKYLHDKGIISGNNGQFFPSNTITRAELVKMVFGAAGTTLVIDGQNYFSDVDPSSWQAKYANTAKVNKVIGGYTDGTFKPNNPITRAEAFKIVINTFHTEALDMVSFPVFDDVPLDVWYAPYAAFAKTENLINFTGNNFDPDVFITRGEIANAIYRMMK